MVNYWINNENSFTLFTGQFPIQPSDKQQENSWFLTFNPERVGRKTKYILRPRKNTYNKLVQKVCFWFVPSARTFTCFYMKDIFSLRDKMKIIRSKDLPLKLILSSDIFIIILSSNLVFLTGTEFCHKLKFYHPYVLCPKWIWAASKICQKPASIERWLKAWNSEYDFK